MIEVSQRTTVVNMRKMMMIEVMKTVDTTLGYAGWSGRQCKDQWFKQTPTGHLKTKELYHNAKEYFLNKIGDFIK